jgi:hypothetical protein
MEVKIMTALIMMWLLLSVYTPQVAILPDEPKLPKPKVRRIKRGRV